MGRWSLNKLVYAFIIDRGNFSCLGPGLIEDNDFNSSLFSFKGKLVVESSN